MKRIAFLLVLIVTAFIAFTPAVQAQTDMGSVKFKQGHEIKMYNGAYIRSRGDTVLINKRRLEADYVIADTLKAGVVTGAFTGAATVSFTSTAAVTTTLNGWFVTSGPTTGIVLTSANGTKYILYATDAGSVLLTAH